MVSLRNVNIVEVLISRLPFLRYTLPTPALLVYGIWNQYGRQL